MRLIPPSPSQRSMSLIRPVMATTVAPGWDGHARSAGRWPYRTAPGSLWPGLRRGGPPGHPVPQHPTNRARPAGTAPPDLGRRRTMTDAVIIDAVRTPGGKRNGKLRNWHAADLASEPLKALVERNDLDPALVDDVIMGCVMQVSEQSLNIGRNAVLAAGWPESVPATTIDRQCGSSQQALHFAAQGVMAGAYDVVVAAGVESMTRTPMGSSVVRDLGYPFGPRMMARYAEKGGLVGQGIGAEMIADQWGISREELDAFSAQSHQRAARATAEGRFENEIIPVAIRDDEGKDTSEQLTSDEGIRPDSSVETLGNLKPAYKPEGGKVTAGT